MVCKAVQIVLDKPEDADLIYGLLAGYNFDGFEEKEALLTGYISDENLPPEAELKAALQDYSFQIEDVQDQNWNALWESNFQPVLLDGFCGIRADFHPPFQKVQYEIVINPRMSFGTGHHATTQMMVRLMQHLEIKGKKVLDFGTGTGILAILASKMGALEIAAIDNDPNAVENARENAGENDATGILFYTQDHPDTEEQKFDVILANINRNIILRAADALIQQLSPGGKLLLSGFLKTDQASIESTFSSHGLTTISELAEGEWVATALQLQ